MRKLLILLCLLLYAIGVGGNVMQAEAIPEVGDFHLASDLPEGKYSSIDELKGKKLGVREGSIQEKYVLENIEEPNLQYLANFTDMAIALTQGKIDAFSLSKVSFDKMVEKYPGITCMDRPLVLAPYYIALSKNEQGKVLQGQLNAYLEASEASGKLAEIKQRWYSNDYSHYELKYSELPATNGVLVLATPAVAEPYAFIYNNKVTGLDLEIITGFCQQYGYQLQVEVVEWAGALSGLESGKYQLAAASLAKSAEREKHAYFSEPYEYAPVAIAVQVKESTAAVGTTSFGELLEEKFQATFITEERWRMFATGIMVTIILSVSAVVFGSLLGFVLCILELSHLTVVKKSAVLVVKLLQGIPVVLLLMILYYIIFATTNINGVIIGIIGFTLIFAAYAAEIFRSGILAVDRGQYDAVKSLGFKKWQGFFKVIFPQAINYNMPVYKSEVITIIKATSVAGYIAINDITKISDIVRSRTFDAFFPLLVAAIFYFLLAYVATLLINLLSAGIDPQRRANFLKDIDASGPLASYDKELQKAHDTLSGIQADSDQTKADAVVVLEVQHLSKKYQNAHPLQDINFTVRQREVVAIIGPSGTGKSTLIRCLNQLEKADAGKILFHGQDINNRSADSVALCRRIGMVFQSFNLFPNLTVIENIMLAPVAVSGLSRQRAYEEGMALLDSVGLRDKSANYPEELSGGQKQRVSIARTLAMHPDIILLDEPTSALDPSMVGEVMEIISRLAKQGTTMIIVTHEMKLAKRIATKVLYIDEGIIYEAGTPEEIFNNPQRPNTRGFLSEQKYLNLDIANNNFALADIMASITVFAHANFLSANDFYHLQLCLEEMLMNVFSGEKTGIWYPLHINISIGANEKMTISFEFKGQENPLAEADELTVKVLQAAYARCEFMAASETGKLIFYL